MFIVRFFCFVWLIISFSQCAEDKFDQKSYNAIAEEVKAEINKLSIACPVDSESIAFSNLSGVNLQSLKEDNSKLELFKNYVLNLDGVPVKITPNKTTKDGFQFQYVADIVEYSLDEKAVTTRDAGTIWLYCDDYKKFNGPKKKPEIEPSKMVTVE